MSEKDIYTCEKHVDKAFDHYLDDNEEFPYLEKNSSTQKCLYCDAEAEYVLKQKGQES